jgi:hypothetical protein
MQITWELTVKGQEDKLKFKKLNEVKACFFTANKDNKFIKLRETVWELSWFCQRIDGIETINIKKKKQGE